MSKFYFLVLTPLFLCACASSPEIPESATNGKDPKKADKPVLNEQDMQDLKSSYRWKKALARRIASRVRQVRQDCKIYQKPTLMSQKISSVESGKDLWTQETDTSWFKVYKDKSYGYISKICF